MRFKKFEIPYLVERPAWWQVRTDEICEIAQNVRRGTTRELTRSFHDFPMLGVYYGDFTPRPQFNNWSSASSSHNTNTYNRRYAEPQTVVICAGIHGSEAEGTVSAVNLISLLETGVDLRGRKRPKLVELCGHYRLIILPCVNMDGRAISPDHLQGASYEDFRKASQGYWLDGSLVGWPGCKEWFPLPLDKVVHPGGYPNGAGYNIMHDACPGNLKTAEAAAVLKMVEQEEADLFVNIHSCENEPFIVEPSNINYPANYDTVKRLRQLCHDKWTETGYRTTPIPNEGKSNCVNINTAVTLACGCPTFVFEGTVRIDCSFDALIEMEYVLFETVLEEGLKKRFADRGEIVKVKELAAG